MKLLPPSENQKSERKGRKRLESKKNDNNKKNVSTILKYFEDKTKKQNLKPVNNSNTSSLTRNLMLQSQPTESADVYTTREGNSDAIFGGLCEQTTSPCRRIATLTSSKKRDHETSQTDPRTADRGAESRDGKKISDRPKLSRY